MNRNDNNNEFFTPGGAEVSIIPVMSGEQPLRFDISEIPGDLPVLALRNAVLFPGTIFPITIGREKSLQLIEDAQKENSFIAAIPQLDVTVEDPVQREDLAAFGTVAKIMKTFDMPDGTVSAVLQGIARVRLEELTAIEPYLRGHVVVEQEKSVDSSDKSARMIAESLKEKAAVILKSSSFTPKEAVTALRSIDDFTFLVNFIATTIELDSFGEKLDLMYHADMKERGMALLSALDNQVELLKIKQEINSKVKSEIDQQQREYYLNNQLRTIQEELGMDEDGEINRLREAAASKNWPESVAATFQKELAKLERYNPSAPESVSYTHLRAHET